MANLPDAASPHCLSPGQCASLACLLEVSAPKVGNVHRGADFGDMSLQDFLVSAAVVAPVFDRAPQQAIGATVLQAVEARRTWTTANTNLGIVLLLAPLASVGRELTPAAVQHRLQSMTRQDASDVYQAIRLAAPGGMGERKKWDIQGDPPESLLEAMREARDRDLIARQYCNGFQEVFHQAAAWLEAEQRRAALPDAIVRTHVRLLAEHPDSLISRKCGERVAEQASQLARAALRESGENDEAWFAALSDLDFWLRSDGNRRNPGATADLIAAGLYVLLIQGRLPTPLQ